MRSGFLLSCCGCVGGLVRASVVVWPLVLVFVSRRCGVLRLLWLGRFRPRWFFSGGLFVDGRRPKNRAQLGISGAGVRQAGAWYGGARIGGDMFVCGIIYSPSGCLFDSCVFQPLPPRRYPLEVPVWELRHVGKYSMAQGSCSELSAVTDIQDSLSIWLSGFLSRHFTVILFFLHFLASSSERSLGDVLVRIPDKLRLSALRQYAVMDLSKAVQLSSA